MRTGLRVESDDWIPNGRKITSEENLTVIEQTLETKGPVILEHWFYRGSRGPEHFLFDDFEDFKAYLDTKVSQGDALHVWSVADVCKDDNSIAHGKYPAEDGFVPRTGAY